MNATKPLPQEAAIRLAHRLTAVRRRGQQTDLPLRVAEGCPRALLGNCFVIAVSNVDSGPIDFAFNAVSLPEIVSEIEYEVSTDPDSTRPLDENVIRELGLPKVDGSRIGEWEEYDEPLWDPVKSEVRVLVREYFEQADADSD